MLCLSLSPPALFDAALLMMYFLNHWGLNGGGALASLIMGMAVSHLWTHGKPAMLAKRADPIYPHTAEHFIGVFWRLIAQPLLFGLAGTGGQPCFSRYSTDKGCPGSGYYACGYHLDHCCFEDVLCLPQPRAIWTSRLHAQLRRLNANCREG